MFIMRKQHIDAMHMRYDGILWYFRPRLAAITARLANDGDSVSGQRRSVCIAGWAAAAASQERRQKNSKEQGV